MDISTNPEKRDSRSRWIWLERALFLAGILCLGIFAWSWIDTRLFERQQNERLEQALSAPATSPRTPRPVNRSPQRPAAETDSFASFEEGAEAVQEKSRKEPPPLAADEGDLVGRIEVPRLGVSAIVLEGVGKRTLRRGAGHIPATARPEEGEGNVGIAAHRDSFFRGLKDIRKKDKIELTTLDGTFQYEVEWTRIVQPEDVSVLEPTDEPVLTLVTCYPFYYVGSAPKRFIVRARKDTDSAAE
ncbi:MAG TPA: class D sortase [Thermoanaerobaculia bacterium]|nr:class D sortase [Thermoanaerobaculia bacterium]